jgi:hypothetical protein
MKIAACFEYEATYSFVAKFPGNKRAGNPGAYYNNIVSFAICVACHISKLY